MNSTLLHGAVESQLGGIAAATVKVAVATTTAPDPGPSCRGVSFLFRGCLVLGLFFKSLELFSI